MDDNTSIQELFRKYLSGRCNAGEIRSLLRYFGDRANEATLKELIHEALNKDLPYREDYGKEVGEVYDRVKVAISENSGRRLPREKWWRSNFGLVAAGLAAIMLCAGIVYWSISPKKIKNELVEEVAGPGGIRELVLPDGSKVWLNSGSRITYSGAFSGATRELSLEGEAFFEVVADSARPFVVWTDGLLTRVLGTSFNVRSNSGEITVSVLSGRVAVTGEQATRELSPGNELSYQAGSGKFTVASVSLSDIGSWKQERSLHFSGIRLSAAISALEAYYGATIHYPEDIANCMVFGDYTHTESLAKTLQIMMLPLEGKVIKRRDNEYSITGDKCI